MSISTRGDILMDIQPLSLPDLTGEHYTEVLKRLHRELRPRSYSEIGTLHGQSLRLANCPSIAIDPDFSQAELNGIVGTGSAIRGLRYRC